MQTFELFGLVFPARALILGVLIGLGYALLGAGLVLVYRSSRVINFAHGQVGALCATVLAKLVLDLGWNFFVALAAVIALGGLVGGAVELLIVRRLFLAPRLQLFVATLAIAQFLLVAQYLVPKVSGRSAGATVYPSPLAWEWSLFGNRLVSPDIMILLFAPAAVLLLGLLLTRTWAGLTIRASSDNPDMAELSGISVRRTSTQVWVIAGGLSALTSVLLFPVQGAVINAPSAALGPGLLMPALAAGLVGGLVSLPRTLIGGVVIGVLQTLIVVNFPTTPGVVDLVLFGVVLVLVLTRRSGLREGASGQWSLALRVPPTPERLRDVVWVRHLGSGIGLVALAFGIVLPLIVPAAGRIFLFSTVLIVALVGLSVTVLTGWAGQLSLGQFGFAGVGAVTTAALMSRGFSFSASVGYAVVAGALVALLVGFPALRVRGLFLAVTTLAFGIAAQGWLFRLDLFNNTNSDFFVPRSELFGFIDLTSQRAYYYLCLTVLTLTAVGVARLRRTGVGRTLVAMRDNEACAASFGLSPAVAKLSAFTFAGAIASLGGALYGGLTVYFSVDRSSGIPPFGPEASLQGVALAVIGGLGSVGGTIIGALYVVGLPALFNDSPTVARLTSGFGLLLLLLYVPGGLASVGYRMRDGLYRVALRRVPPVQAAAVPTSRKQMPRRATLAWETRDADSDEESSGGASAPALQVEGVSVRFGGLAALTDVSIRAEFGEIVGLIGSNGAGKSTLMNVVSGFQSSVSGVISLFGEDVTQLAPHQRARLGVGRVFQDARLFGDLTVRETVKVALEAHERSEFIPSLLGYPPSRRAERRRTAEADEVIDFLGLGRYADTFASNLSTGTRRIVELSCLVARGSRLILLDEPTAGVAQRETEAFGPIITRIKRELGATVVIIEHDMPLVLSISDRVYCLHTGQVIAEGDPESIRTDPAVVAAYLGTDERAIARSGAIETGEKRNRPKKTRPGATPSDGHAPIDTLVEA